MERAVAIGDGEQRGVGWWTVVTRNISTGS
jgi:hypothetical protein